MTTQGYTELKGPMKMRQTPFREEPEFVPDGWHCFNCGCEDVSMEVIRAAKPGEVVRILRYRSLYPLKMLYVSHAEDGRVDLMKGTNGDYSVCAPCYRLQYQDRYGIESPV